MPGDGPASPSLAPRKKRRVVPDARVVHGDCVQGMQTGVDDDSVSLVLADPPYGVGNFSWDGSEGYMGFAEAWLTEVKRVLKPGGSLLFFGSPCTIWTSRMNVLLEDTLGMKHMQTLTWVYSQGGDARLETMKQYAVRSEAIEWWVKTPGMVTYNPTLAAERYSEEDKRTAMAKGVGRVNEASLDKGRPPRTWFDVPRENSRSKERQYGKHPSMKPMALAERLINVHTNSGDRVLVPFAGSGSEVLVATKLGREVIGYETQDDYIKLMIKRFDGHGAKLSTTA